MKRLLAWISLVAVTFSLCACGESATYVPDYDSDYIYEEYEEFDNFEDYESTETDGTIEETESELMGSSFWTTEKIQKYLEYDGARFFVRYPDNSFSELFTGSVIDWGMPEPYTYGTERSCSNLVMCISHDNENMAKLEKGELIFVSGPKIHEKAYIFPVIESGYAMSGRNPEGFVNTLLWEKEDGSAFDYEYFTQTRERRKISMVNGVPVGTESIFEKNDDDKYVTLKEGDTYTIGEVVGTQLYESEYYVDCVYYLHTYDTDYFLYEYPDETYSFDLQPTTDGYAVVDLSELPQGDYVIMYTYWDEEEGRREARTIHIRID